MNIANISEYFLWFIVYSFLGWSWECIITSIPLRRFINRGFLNGPYCPIYGAGCLLIILFAGSIDNPFLRFFLGATIACALEYATSWILEVLFQARWWDYTPRLIHLNGRICLEGFLVFGLAAILLPKLHEHVAAFTGHFSSTVIIVTAAIIAVAFISDIIATNRALTKFNRILREYQKVIDRRRLDFLKFIRRGRRVFEMRINKTQRIRNVLSFQQRRILAAFPRLDSTRYRDALAHIRKLNSDSRKNIVIKKANTGTSPSINKLDNKPQPKNRRKTHKKRK